MKKEKNRKKARRTMAFFVFFEQHTYKVNSKTRTKKQMLFFSVVKHKKINF
jgi:hypothetical protein